MLKLTMTSCSAIKQNNGLTCATTWMNLAIVMLQPQKPDTKDYKFGPIEGSKDSVPVADLGFKKLRVFPPFYTCHLHENMPGQTAGQTKVKEWGRALQPMYTCSTKQSCPKAQHMRARTHTHTHTHTHLLMRVWTKACMSLPHHQRARLWSLGRKKPVTHQ